MANLTTQFEQSGSALTFESTPWLAVDRTIEEPRRAPEPPLELANEEHVIELEESASLRRAE